MLTGFMVQGRCYEEQERLEFFPPPGRPQQRRVRVAVIYGKNGTGKSTISSALAQLRSGSVAGLDSVSELAVGTDDSFDSPGVRVQELTIDPVLASVGPSLGGPMPQVRSAVFNEEYVENNVKLREDGLETVVLFGEQAGIETDLEEARGRLAATVSEMEANEASVVIARRAEQIAYRAVQAALKGGWAKRQQRIRRNPGATPVNSAVIAKFSAAVVQNSSGVTEQLEERIAAYLSFTELPPPERFWAPLVHRAFADEVKCQLLDRTIDPPTGSGIARIVGESLATFGSSVHKAREIFAHSKISHCPMCQQIVSAPHRAALLHAIAEAIDEEASLFTEEIERAKLYAIEIPGRLLDGRLQDLVSRYESARITYNRFVEVWNDVCNRKKESLYALLSWDSEPFRQAAREFEESVAALESRHIEILGAITTQAAEKIELERLNSALGRWEVDVQLRDHATACAAVRDLEESQRRLQSQFSAEERAVASLLARSQNVHVAADEINAALRSIFSESHRLELVLNPETGSGRYFLHNRGRAMSPSHLSVGERNIVALAYFFTTVRQQLEELARGSSGDWMVVVLDDPVSSVDVDNRLGIHGFLEAQLRRVLGHGHQQTKVVMLTHDLTVARELEKSAASALSSIERKKDDGASWSQVQTQLISRFVLTLGHQLDGPHHSLSKLNEYQSLVRVAWEFAHREDDSSSSNHLVIGNVVRRILEAFSTFIYNESSIPSASVIAEYERVTGGRESVVDLGPGHRLFLHENSHSSDALTALSDYGGFAGLSFEERVLHVRKVLAFMYTLQPAHVLAFSPIDSDTAAAVLDTWCSEHLGH